MRGTFAWKIIMHVEMMDQVKAHHTLISYVQTNCDQYKCR